MKKTELRFVLLSLLSIFTASSGNILGSLIPIAYFAALYTEGLANPLLFFCSSLGLVLSLELSKSLQYIAVLLTIIVITTIIQQHKKELHSDIVAVICGIIVMIFSIWNNPIPNQLPSMENNFFIQAILLVLVKYPVLAIILQGILTIVFINLFITGTHYLLYHKKGQVISNEELISIAILFSVFLNGIPSNILGNFSLKESIMYLILLIMGYKYGAGAGAIIGIAFGFIQGLPDQIFETIGMMCMVGMLSGMFREIGKIGMSIIYLFGAVMLSYLWNKGILNIIQLRGIVCAFAVFLFTPEKYMIPIDSRQNQLKGDGFVGQNLQNVAKRKLKEFSDSFRQLSKSFEAISETKQEIGEKELEQILEDLSERFCVSCKNCNTCWSRNYDNTSKTTYEILNLAKKNGMVLEGDIPIDFKARCMNLKDLVKQTNQELEIAKLNLDWQNRMAESREAIAGQLLEVSELIDDFSNTLYSEVSVNHKMESKILEVLHKNHIEVKKIAILENKKNKIEIYLTMRTRWGRCMTTKEAAKIIGQSIDHQLKASSTTKKIISRNYDIVQFVEDTTFKMLYGVAKRTKEGEQVSGDNFSVQELESGELVMLLSDGMGCGIRASEESRSVIELLEQFLETGIKQESAIKLINSIFVLKSNEQTFSTIDMSIVNLFTGTCDFIKIGAAATFIKRKNWVETIRSTSLPAGIFNQVDFEAEMKKLYEGDMIIMMTDGILDCIKEEDKEHFMEELLSRIESNNPQEIAEHILNKVLEESDHHIIDDMTVLVAGIWKKSVEINK